MKMKKQSIEKKFDKRMMFGSAQTGRMIEPCTFGSRAGHTANLSWQTVSNSLWINANDWSIPYGLIFPEAASSSTSRQQGVCRRRCLGHQVQRAIYQKAMGNFGCKFSTSHQESRVQRRWRCQETLDYIGKDHQIRTVYESGKEHLRQIVPVNPNSFYWRGNEDARRVIWGLG